MKVVLERDQGRRYRSYIHRDDGVVLLLPGYDRKWRVPHDLAHLVAERELGLTDGVFGSIAAGAMFENMQVVSGRLRHDARERSRRILRANGRAIMIAELMAAAVHHAVEQRDRATLMASARRSWCSLQVDPFPYSEAELLHAADTLDADFRAWRSQSRTDPVEFTWPIRPRQGASRSRRS